MFTDKKGKFQVVKKCIRKTSFPLTLTLSLQGRGDLIITPPSGEGT